MTSRSLKKEENRLTGKQEVIFQRETSMEMGKNINGQIKNRSRTAKQNHLIMA